MFVARCEILGLARGFSEGNGSGRMLGWVQSDARTMGKAVREGRTGGDRIAAFQFSGAAGLGGN